MFTQVSSNLIFLLICLCDAPQPSQDLGTTVKPVIREAINIDSSKTYTLQVLNSPSHHTVSEWIYPDWMWSRDAIATKSGPFLWIPAETISLNLDQVERHGSGHGIGDGAFILGSPDDSF